MIELGGFLDKPKALYQICRSLKVQPNYCFDPLKIYVLSKCLSIIMYNVSKPHFGDLKTPRNLTTTLTP